jgi:serine protease
MSSKRGQRRVQICAAISAGAVGVTLAVSGTAAASQTSAAEQHPTTQHHKIVMHQRGWHSRGRAAGRLQWLGGPVEHSAKVYLVFWGAQWNSDGNNAQSYLTNYFAGLGNGSEAWSTVMDQYTDNNGNASSGNPVLAGTWVDDASNAPASSTQADISAEANAGAAHFGVSGADVDIFVVSPSGTSPDNFPNAGFCAWHDWNGNVAYTNMPYVLDAGSSCGANSVQEARDGFSIVGGHEYAEAETDPQAGNGWLASDGEENGDLCAWQGLTAVGTSTGSFAVQPTWSNAVSGCATSG